MTHQELFDQAVIDIKADQLDQAEVKFNYLLDGQPNHPDIWFYVATCFMKRGYMAVAELLFLKVLEMDPNSVASCNNLGNLRKTVNDQRGAEKYFLKAIELFPKGGDMTELSIMWSNLGTTFVVNGTPEKAIRYCRKALELDINNQYAHWNLSLSLLENAEWKEGWKEYEHGFAHKKRISKEYNEIPIWDGDQGQTVIVYGEQGMGDELMYMSMLDELSKECNIIYDCHPRLADIARNSFDFPVYGTRKVKDVQWKHNADAKIAIGSLGGRYRNRNKDFPGTPYLKADVDLTEQIKKRLDALGDKPKIGLSWKGGYKLTRKDLRSMTVDQLGPIIEQDATFISLQYTLDADKEAAAAGIVHWQECVDSYDHTAALVSNLDLVISVCTSVIYLSGALGVPCWVMTPSKPAWRYLVKGPMPWFNSVRLFRQQNENWDSVIKQIKGELCRLLAKNIAA